MFQLALAGLVLLVSIVIIMVWPISSRSRWNPSGRVRISSVASSHPDGDKFSIATSLGAQAASASH